MRHRLWILATSFVIGAGAVAYAACSSSEPETQRSCVTTSDCKGAGSCIDGLCTPDAPILKWKSLPRARSCRAYSECPFEVTSTGDIDRYEWRFSDDKDDGGPLVTKEPSCVHKYPPGAQRTKVTAFAKNGTLATLDGDDDICVDGVELACVRDLVNCCLGSCAPEGGCR